MISTGNRVSASGVTKVNRIILLRLQIFHSGGFEYRFERAHATSALLVLLIFGIQLCLVFAYKLFGQFEVDVYKRQGMQFKGILKANLSVARRLHAGRRDDGVVVSGDTKQ